MDINQRHKLILDTIVSMYIKDGEPIASQALQDRLNITVSSATLRNEMAMLTKLGYLIQPHVSAGRVPTNKAYRYYIENLGGEGGLEDKDKSLIKAQFDMLDGDSQRFLAGAAKLFSDILGLTVIIAPPVDTELKFVNITALKTGRYNIVLVGVTDRGDVHTRVVRLSEEISDVQLEQLSSVINARLCLVCYADIDKKYFAELCNQLSKENKAFAQLVWAALALIKQANNQSVYVSGQEYLLNTDHFESNIGDLLKLLAKPEILKQIITPKFDGVSVVFGDELPIPNVENACFISTKYFAGSAVSGTLAIICPQTVDYKKLFLAVEYFSQLLTQTITGTERK
ncbi:MAG: heat-inducible transcriptional repressor HrcA [Oscillospiraceae bacterium]